MAFKDKPSDKEPPGSKRSDQWPKVRRSHLKQFPTCALCGGDKKLEVHHVQPYHLYPDLELNPSNLITLCENKNDGLNCHLAFGHLGNFKSFNAQVVTDVQEWHNKISNRPTSKGKLE